jgi:proteasome component ECM29
MSSHKVKLCALQRAPSVFKCDVELAERFFHALATEPDGIRAIVQEAINRLAAAYRAAPPAERQELKTMLSKQRVSAADGVRMCAVAWACTVFERGDPFARHLCILAAADAKPEVRSSCQRSLHWRRDRSKTFGVCTQMMAHGLDR